MEKNRISLFKKVKSYLLLNPIKNEPNKYKSVCEKFNITIKYASYIWKKLEKENPYLTESSLSKQEVVKILKATPDEKQISLNNIDTEVKTLEDLFEVCEINPAEWDVVSWECKKWDLGIKNKDGEIEVKPLYSVSAKFKKLNADTDISLQKDVLLKELYKVSPVVEFKHQREYQKTQLLELALFDMHFGKLAHADESGEDYDLKIAEQRYYKAISTLLSRVNLKNIGRILLPVGQDLINVDNLQNSTTAGTPQDCDSRFHKIVKTVKRVLITTIDSLKQIAPIDVVISVGNHDEQTSFLIGEMLDAYYHNDKNVEVFNSASLRKYYKFGITSIMFTHGNRERFNDLGMIFAAEKPELWANTKQRFIQIGHYHHNKVQVLQKQEFQGFQVEIIPSLSASDAWHTGKGFNSLKQAKAFLYDKDEGRIGEFPYTV